jgi:polysaccharide biosynthesis/export protein VpsN
MARHRGSLVAERRTVLLWLTLALVPGCAGGGGRPRAPLPPPEESTTVGPGDQFHLEVVGEKELPREYQVASDGTVDLPFIARVEVQGLEPQEIAALVRQRLIEEKILRDPSVIVRVTAYNSKRVSVLGQVQRPGSFPLTPGMTLVQVVSEAGGFNSIANRDRVTLTRRTKQGSRTVVVSIDAIMDGQAPDIPLQAGDQIYVHERVF